MESNFSLLFPILEVNNTYYLPHTARMISSVNIILVYICMGGPLAYWDCEFQSPRGHGCLSLLSVVCRQVEVSASSRSLVRRSPTECGVSECDCEVLIMKMPWPTRDCCAIGEKIYAWEYRCLSMYLCKCARAIKCYKFAVFINKRDNVCINMALKRIRVTIVAVEKQKILHIPSVYL